MVILFSRFNGDSCSYVTVNRVVCCTQRTIRHSHIHKESSLCNVARRSWWPRHSLRLTCHAMHISIIASKKNIRIGTDACVSGWHAFRMGDFTYHNICSVFENISRFLLWGSWVGRGFLHSWSAYWFSERGMLFLGIEWMNVIRSNSILPQYIELCMTW